MTAGETRLLAWERRLDWPLTGLAVIFLGLYAFDVLNTRLSDGQHEVVDLVLTGIWVLFAADFIVRLSLARNHRRFFRTHLLDVLILVLPMARPLRALRVLTVIGALNKRLRGGLHGKAAVYVVATTLLVGTIAALAVLDAERNAPHATITTFGDAVWWTISTITTVGYGDLYPITTEGRIVAGTLMVGGIALLGVITGSFATWFVASIRDLEEEVDESGDEVNARLDEVLVELRLLSTRVRELESSLTRPDRPDQVSPDGAGA
ncbi:MAG: voltage-gated potassium channel [Pseudonocardiales bacterium]|jgi:voltage-gated potassium channel|uniref:potassium channel family protein n=1 Tax=Pseudonocardia sp. Cha107L01 TaxID=3457576 RepID=UPI0028C7BB10|nr:voltage-gated potassium channel [Pseudonocardiales bacterium]MDT7631445.1 voltage-gated potassium channel [Pseudonocardiales bacterium]MDT7676708.1 voltage-gated potassium channel [Pseudonocardiales bacterium]